MHNNKHDYLLLLLSSEANKQTRERTLAYTAKEYEKRLQFGPLKLEPSGSGKTEGNQNGDFSDCFIRVSRRLLK